MNFKVKCTGVHEGNPRFTNGKIYEVRNGKLFADKSVRYEAWAKPINGKGDFEALRKWFKGYYDFELVEEHKTKYKAGDKVRVRSDLKRGGCHYHMNDHKGIPWFVMDSMYNLRGKVVTITEYCESDHGYYVEETRRLLWTDEMFEGLATENKPENKKVEDNDMNGFKYKVGDKVIASDNEGVFKSAVGVITALWFNPNHPTPYCVKYHDYYGEPIELWSSVERLADVIEDKIVITHDGKTTTATMYCADGTKKVATVRCAPEDTFDFEFGAKLAMDRLMESIENSKYTVVEVSFKSGRTNYHYKTKDYATKVGMKIMVPVGGNNREIEATITNVVPGFAYIGTFPISEMKEIEIKEVQLYNGKVVCINNCGNPHEYTVGKIYQFVNGVLISNSGFPMNNGANGYHSFAEWEKSSVSKWIEIVE